MILATVSSDLGFHRDVRAALESRFRFESSWELGYDDAARLQGVKSDQKCLNIVDFSNGAAALQLARILRGRSQVATVAVGCGDSRDDLMMLMQAGVRDVLSQFTFRDLLQAVGRSVAALGDAGDIVADLYAFVPAKPGSGATTVATHTAGMASQLAEDPMLLLDFDIRLGVTTFLLKAEGTRTVIDALQQVDRLDEDVWAGLASQIGNLHMLGSGATDFSHTFHNEQFRALLDFAVRQYSAIAVDLPGSMDDYECEVMMRSKRILLVTTPDVGALHVARRKAQWFRDLKLTDKVSVVLNYVERRNALSVKEIEQIIQLPIRYLLPADHKGIEKAVQKGEILDSSCSLGKQIKALATEIVPAKAMGRKANPVRRFVDYFSVSPARRRSA